MKERHVSWSWRRSRGSVGWQQMIWKKKSRACELVKKEEAVVRLSPIGAASTRLWSSSSPCGAAHARQQIHALQEEFNRRREVPATPVHMARREERGEEFEGQSSQSPNGSTSTRWAQ